MEATAQIAPASTEDGFVATPLADIELKIDASVDIGEWAAAMAKAQGAMGNAMKNSENPHFRSKYADLSAFIDVARGPLSDNQIALVQIPASTRTGVAVVTMLVHKSGQFLRGRLDIPVQQPTAQTIGSAITYAKRYSLGGMLGIASEEDDDGNLATGRPPTPQWNNSKPQARAQQPEPKRPVDPPASSKITSVPDPTSKAGAKPPDQKATPVVVPDPVSAELQQRKRRVFDSRKRAGKAPSTEEFLGWVKAVIGEPKLSKDWTEDDLEKLEIVVKENEDVPF